MNPGTWSFRTASLVAGVALAVMAVVAGLSTFGAVEALITPGDAVATARDIAAAEPVFRLGIAGLLLVVVLDVVVAAGLYVVLAPVSQTGSLLAAWLRVAYAAVFGIAIGQLVLALGRLEAPDAALHLIEAFDTLWQIGLILFGTHLLLVGGLTYRSGYLPKILGALLAIAGLGYLVDGLGTVLVAGYVPGVAQVTFVGEVVLIFWLLIKGRRIVGEHHALSPSRLRGGDRTGPAVHAGQ
jgi:Domain of unknown function (DUF4386)